MKIQRLLFLILTFSLSIFPSFFKAQTVQEQNCMPLWETGGNGQNLGLNQNMLSHDFNKDGYPDLIVSAVPNLLVPEYGYWHAFEFDPIEGGFEKIFTSPALPKEIDKIAIGDIDEDGTEELVVAHSNTFYIYDLSKMELIKEFEVEQLSINGEIEDMEIYDLWPSDGAEIIVSTRDEILAVNPQNELLYLHTQNIEAGQFGIGQADSDSPIEIAFSDGSTYEYRNFELILEYDFLPVDFSVGWIEMINLDDDPEDEAIVIAPSGDVVVMNIKEESLINQFSYTHFGTEQGIAIGDLIGDDNVELLLEQSDGSIVIYDPLTSSKIKSIYYETISKTGLSFADYDQDGNIEIITSVEESSFNLNKELAMIDVLTGTVEWEANNLGSSYSAVKIHDLNEDGQLEIISVNLAYDEGKKVQVLIHDLESRNLLFSTTTDLPSAFSDEIKDFEIYDYGNDGDLDLILIQGSLVDTRVWVLDGSSFELELVGIIILDSNTSGILASTIVDVDQDGIEELILIDERRVYEFSLDNFNLKWSSEPILSAFGKSAHLEVADLNNNGFPELIFMDDRIFSLENRVMTDSGIFDREGLVIADISGNREQQILSTRLNNLEIYDPSDFSLLRSIPIPFSNFDKMKAADLDQDGKDEICFSAEERIGFISENGDVVYSQFFGADVALYENLIIEDLDEDGKFDLFFGTNNKIIELDISCFACVQFNPEISFENAKCSDNNGKIIFGFDDPHVSYEWDGISQTEDIINLDAGSYQILASNTSGCMLNRIIEIDREELITNISTSDIICEGEGQASVIIAEGKAPFQYEWDEVLGVESIFNTLAAGEHEVIITDQNDCSNKMEFSIDSLYLQIELQALAFDCNQEGNGNATVDIIKGVFPFTFNWEGGISNDENANQLSAGTYAVTITDANQCVDSSSIEILPATFELNFNTTDVSCFGGRDGELGVEVIEGLEPIIYNWSNGFSTQSLNTLAAGPYSLMATDANGCNLSENFNVSSPDELNLNLTTMEDIASTTIADGSAEISVSGGTPPYTYSWSTGETSSSIENLAAGMYSLTVSDANLCEKEIEFSIELLNAIDQVIASSIDIFPNPSATLLNIFWDNESNIQLIELYNSKGLKVKKQIVSFNANGECLLKIDGLASGEYFLKLISEASFWTQKIIIAN